MSIVEDLQNSAAAVTDSAAVSIKEMEAAIELSITDMEAKIAALRGHSDASLQAANQLIHARDALRAVSLRPNA